MTQANPVAPNPTTSNPGPLPPTDGPRPIVESNGYLNGRFTDHVSAPMNQIAADPDLCDWWLKVLVKMLTDNPAIPYGAPLVSNPTGKNLILQLDGEACKKGLLAMEKVKNRQNWSTVKILFGLLDDRLWQKQAQSANWRQAYPGLYDSRCSAAYVPAFFNDTDLIMVSHYAGIPSPA